MIDRVKAYRRLNVGIAGAFVVIAWGSLNSWLIWTAPLWLAIASVAGALLTMLIVCGVIVQAVVVLWRTSPRRARRRSP